MKKSFLHLIVLIGLCLQGAACSKAEIEELVNQEAPVPTYSISTTSITAEQTEYSYSYEEDKELIELLGYDTSCMIENGDHYLVGTEYIFYKSTLQEYRRQPRFGLEQETKLRSDAHHVQLTCSWYDSDIPELVKNATTEWNKLEKCDIVFRSNFEPEKEPFKWGPNVWILPSDDSSILRYEPLIEVRLPASNLKINTDHPLWQKLPTDQKKYLIMHGLGHVIGLKDFTDPISGMFSIMLSEQFLSENLNLWSGFSTSDIWDLEKLYPLPESSASFSVAPLPEGANSDSLRIGTAYKLVFEYDVIKPMEPEIVFSVKNLDNYIKYNMVQSGNTLNIEFTSPGACIIRVAVKDNNNTEVYSTEKAFTVYQEEPHFILPESISIGSPCTFKIEFPDKAPAAKYTYTVKESVFDNNTNKSVAIIEDGQGQAEITFKDSGDYIVTATVTYGNKTKTFKYRFAKFYKPECIIMEEAVPAPDGAIVPEDCIELYSWNRIRVKMGPDETLPHRIVCYIHDVTRIQSWRPPLRVNYTTISDTQYYVIRQAKESADYYLTPQPYYSSSNTGLGNYPDAPTYVYPYAYVIYPQDVQGLL